MQLNPEQARRPNHDVRKPAEAEVQLEPIANNEEPDIDSAQSSHATAEKRMVESRIHARARVQPATHDRRENRHQNADRNAAHSNPQVVVGYRPILAELR